MTAEARPISLALLAGLVIGLVAAITLPRLLGPYLPSGLRGKEQVLGGVVVAKRAEGDRLLVTRSTPQGTTLATFTEQTDKIDLLVRTGDSLSIAVREYGPFTENPRIARVVSSGAVTTPAGGDTGTAATIPRRDSTPGAPF